MKWKNKGHEFDEMGKHFENKKKIFIYGAGEIGMEAYKQLEFLDCIEGFIDNDVKKQQLGYMGKSVESIVEFLKRDVGKYIVIVAASLANSPIFIGQLIRQGYVEGQNCFLWNRFNECYLPIYAAYGWNKIYFSSISLLPTTHCNLNCASCLSFTPYNKNKRHRDIESLKSDLDSYFQWIDYTGLFHISGGEPFLYPNLIELLEYIGKEYRHKIKDLTITTNGTVIPLDIICIIMKKYKINIILDDYTEKIGKLETLNKIVNLLNEKEIPYIYNKVHNWIDLKPLSTDNSYMDEKTLERYYNACSVPYSSLQEEKIYSCNYANYAMEAGIMKVEENDYYSLKPFNTKKKIELLEFRLGYSKKGYVDMCKQCAGYIPINQNIVPAAEQVVNRSVVTCF